MFVLNTLSLCVIILILKYCWSKRKLYVASWNLPGLLSFPLIGSAYVFWNTSDIVLIISKLNRRLGSPVGFWLGPRFLIYFDSPDDAEIIINSTHSMDKGGVYKYVEEMIGGPGLFSSGGDVWKMHRRLLNPTVQNSKILNSFYPFMNECLKVLVEKLENKQGKGVFNIYDYIEACSFDNFVKNTFGIDLNVQNNENTNVLKTINEALHIVGIQIFQPWYQFKPIFRLSKYNKIREQTTKDMRSFIQDVFRKRIVELSGSDSYDNKEEFGEKRLRIFIDEIIKLSFEEKCFSEDDMISESLTMLLAGFETSAVTISNILIMFALHPEYQERAFQEIRGILPHNDTVVTAEDLNQLSFTDRFIKESMRLAPTVPFTGRRTKDDFYVGKLFVPAGTELIISIHEMQRNEKIWGADAKKFNPDNFSPENVESRHPYSFLPFSNGARNCIGKKYAQIVIRMFVVWLLRHYVFSTDLKLEDLEYKWMIVMKLKNGYPIKIEKREKY